MKQLVSRNTSIGLGLSLAALVGIGTLSYWNLARYRDAVRWENHTQKVLSSTDELLSKLKDAEVGQRGFLLTNDRSYLEPYEASIATIDQTFNQLKQLTADNSTHQLELAEIDRLMKQRLAILQQTIELADRNQIDAARSIIKSNDGKVLMDQIRDRIADMKTTENRLLAARSQLEQQRLNWITSFTIPGCLVVALFLELMLLKLRRNLAQQQLVEEALRKQNDKLKLLYETTRDLLSADDPIVLLDQLYDKLSVQLSLDIYASYLVEQKDDRPMLRLASAQGLTPEQQDAIAWLEFGQSMCGQVIEKKQQIYVSNAQKSPLEAAALIKALGITAFCGQPLITQNGVLGTLSFASRSRTHFSSEEVELMQAAADQVAIALERSNLIKSLQRRSDQLAQSNRLKDEFFAVLSHELRTPLNPILGWTQLLQQRKFDQANVDRALAIIERNAKAQIHLIDDLLDVSRIMKGKLALKSEPVNLKPVIEAAIETVRLAAEAKAIVLRFTVLEDRAVLGDPNRIQQIIWNLLSNAVKFTPNSGLVEVELSLPEIDLATNGKSSVPIVEITVRDTGIGIEPEFLPYIFDYFRQADGSITRHFGGLGLGLAIVRHLVELHGGTICVQSDGADQGTTFTIQLPALMDCSPKQLPTLNDATAIANTEPPLERSLSYRLSLVSQLDAADSSDSSESPNCP